MMPAGIVIKSNIKQWQKQAEQAAGQVNGGVLTRKISIKISRRMRDFSKQEFVLGQAGGWEPLSPEYAKRKGTTGAGILRLTDRLFKSVTERGGENIAAMRRKVAGYTYRFGTRVPYGEFHQEGAGNLPKREFIKVDEGRELVIQRDIGELTVQHLARLPFFDKLRGAGFRISGSMPGQAVGVARG